MKNVAMFSVAAAIVLACSAGLFAVPKEAARAGFDNLLAFIALISINLAVVNLLPIPVLDGGAFLILAVEAVIRRPLPPRLREAVTIAGLAIVVLLMVVAFWNDIGRLLAR